MAEIKEEVRQEQVIISIAAGISIDAIKQGLSNKCRIVEPCQYPAMVKQGMTGICFSQDEFSEEEKSIMISFSSLENMRYLMKGL